MSKLILFDGLVQAPNVPYSDIYEDIKKDTALHFIFFDCYAFLIVKFSFKFLIAIFLINLTFKLCIHSYLMFCSFCTFTASCLLNPCSYCLPLWLVLVFLIRNCSEWSFLVITLLFNLCSFRFQANSTQIISLLCPLVILLWLCCNYRLFQVIYMAETLLWSPGPLL